MLLQLQRKTRALFSDEELPLRGPRSRTKAMGLERPPFGRRTLGLRQANGLRDGHNFAVVEVFVGRCQGQRIKRVLGKCQIPNTLVLEQKSSRNFPNAVGLPRTSARSQI